MQKLCIISIYLLFALSTYGQKKETAQDILARVSQTYQGYQSLKASFSFSVENQGKQAGPVQKGTLTLKGARYRVNLDDRVFISDGKDQWTVLKAVKEVQVTEVDKSGETLNPTNIFSFYKNGYITELMEDESRRGVACYTIQLKPTRKEQDLDKITMHIRKDNYRIADVTLLDGNGNEMQYTIEQQQTNMAIPEKTFEFHKSEYPDMELVDLR